MSVNGRILSIEDWPPIDQQMWQRAIQNGGLLDEVGPLAHMAEPTRDMIKAGYGKWLAWLTEVQPASLSAHPADRIDLETFVGFIDSTTHLSPHTQHFYADTTLRLLSLCFPDHAWDPFKRIVRCLQRLAKEHVSHRKDGRILSGVRASMWDTRLERGAERLRQTMCGIWPELQDVKISHAWYGFTGFSFNHMPQVGEHDGIFYAMGFSGSGTVMAPYLGAKVAYRALGDPRGETAYANTLFKKHFLHQFEKPHFLKAADVYYRHWVDRVENWQAR